MLRFDYQCRQCGVVELEKRLGAPHPMCCPTCGAEGLRALVRAPAAVLVRGGAAARRVDGERRLRRELVLHNADGSDSVYGSVAEALRDDRGRGTPPGLRRKNWERLVQLGYVPGTRQAAQAQAIEDAPVPPLRAN